MVEGTQKAETISNCEKEEKERRAMIDRIHEMLDCSSYQQVRLLLCTAYGILGK